MSDRMSRREMLVRSAGALAGLGLAGALAVGPARDRSAEAPTSPVAIQRCESYEPALVRERLETALDAIGGIGKLVANRTVTVKLNLTGHIRRLHGRPAWETYHVHPHVVGALCAALDGSAPDASSSATPSITRRPPRRCWGRAAGTSGLSDLPAATR